MKIMLIGGSRAGELVTVEFPMGDIHLPRKRETAELLFDSFGSEPKPTDIEIERYKLSVMCDCSGKRHQVYTLAGMDPLLELVRSYGARR